MRLPVNKICRTLDLLSLNWFIPVVRLCAGDNPRQQLLELWKMVGIPLAAIGLFLALWAGIASNIKTDLGTVPGPRDVLLAARGMVEQYRDEKQKEADFYAREPQRREFAAKHFPDRPYKAALYAGQPTYPGQIFTSLVTVFAGFLLAALVAVPLGILCGSSKLLYNAINPFVQIFKPVSPLAWLPIVMILVSALYTSKNPLMEKSFVVSAITVALCSLWPALINTAVGVASIDKDHMNVARVLRLGFWTRVRKIIIPSALPYIFTGLRLSLGVGWMVLIAAEMLAQNPGLGKYVWDLFQSGSTNTLSLIMVVVFTVGIIGFVLDRLMVVFQKLVSYDRAAIA